MYTASAKLNKKFWSLMLILTISFIPNLSGILNIGTLSPALVYTVNKQDMNSASYFGYDGGYGLAGGASSVNDALLNDDAKCIYVSDINSPSGVEFGFDITGFSAPSKPSGSSWTALTIFVIVWPDNSGGFEPEIFDLDVTAYTNGGQSQSVRFYSGKLHLDEYDYSLSGSFDSLLASLNSGQYITRVVVDATSWAGIWRIYLNLDYLRVQYTYTTYAPSAPSLNDITLNNYDDGYPQLSWTVPSSDGGESIQGYRIYRSTAPGQQGSLIATVGSGTLNYLDSAVTPGTTYYYTVRAYNVNGEGAPSTQKSITSLRKPFAPTLNDIVLNSPNQGYPQLTWTAPSNNGGSSIQAYRIYRSTTSGIEGSQIASVGSSILTYIDNTVGYGTRYYYTVRAENVYAIGEPSSQKSIIPSTIPSAPTLNDIVSNNLDQGYPQLTWTAPSNTGGDVIQNYRIYRSTVSGEKGSLLTTVSPTTLSYNDSSISYGITYYYTVCAVNNYWEGNSSLQKSIYTCRKPVPVTINNVQNNYPNSTIINWTASTNSGLPIISYKIYKSTTPGILGSLLQSVGNTTLSYIDYNLNFGTIYYYTVQAENALGNSNSSNQVSIKALKVPLSANINLITPNIDSNTIHWTPSSDEGGSTSIIYTLWWGTSPTNMINSITISSSPFIHSGLSSSTIYYYKIETKNELNWNANTSTFSNKTWGSAPTAVRNLTITSLDFAINLTWEQPQYLAGPSVNYTIYRKIGNNEEQMIATNVLNCYYHDSALFLVDDYSYRVVAGNQYGSGPSINIIGNPKTFPGQIQTVTPTPAHKAIQLNWSIPRSGGYTIENYMIYYRSESMQNYEFLTNTTTNQYVHSISQLSIRYYYYITSWNLLGESVASPIVNAYPDCKPDSPTNYTIENTKQKVQLKWYLPKTINYTSAVFNYHIYRGTSENDLEKIGSTTYFWFDDTTAVYGTIYFYRICAENNAGLGNFTSIKKGQRILNLTVNLERRKTGIEISFNSVPDAYEYHIIRSTMATAAFASITPITKLSTATLYRDEDLDTRGVYFYVVRVFNSDGQLIAESEPKSQVFYPANDPMSAIADIPPFVFYGAGGLVVVFVVVKIIKNRKENYYMKF